MEDLHAQKGVARSAAWQNMRQLARQLKCGRAQRSNSQDRGCRLAAINRHTGFVDAALQSMSAVSLIERPTALLATFVARSDESALHGDQFARDVVVGMPGTGSQRYGQSGGIVNHQFTSDLCADLGQGGSH